MAASDYVPMLFKKSLASRGASTDEYTPWLDEDAAVLHWLDRTRDLDQLAGGDIRIGEGARLDEFNAVLAPCARSGDRPCY